MSKAYVSPSKSEYEALARRHNVVPVFREILADEETPVSAFGKLQAGEDVALLESVEGGETWGRYSMITLDPALQFESRGTSIRVERFGPVCGIETFTDDEPLRVLNRLVSEHDAARLDGLPHLAGGAVGYAGYDVVRGFERLPDQNETDLELPESRWVFFDTIVLFDHQFHTVKLVVITRPEGDVDHSYRTAIAKIDSLLDRLRRPLLRSTGDVTPQPVPQFTSTVSEEEFIEGVNRAKEYVRSGDVVQVVLAHRLEADLGRDPFEVYRALRVINPSPYMFFLRFEGTAVLGASPEVLVRREGERVEVRPIAGTRPRGKTEDADSAYEEDLLASAKERAEHVMLVDLGRNDVGRIAEFESVEVSEFMQVERYSHVMHLVSNVRGRVSSDRSNGEILRACFPAGTVSGAPKIRAMEIIEELEPIRRGIYAGAVGYFDFHGNMDTCIAIRTLVYENGRAYIGVGAGIVADSDPLEEYRETMTKGSALMRACELAAIGLERFDRSLFQGRVSQVPKRERSTGPSRRGEERS